MIGEDLNQILATEGISVTQLAARLNVSSAMLSFVIAGERRPGLKMIRGMWKHYRQLCKKYLEAND